MKRSHSLSLAVALALGLAACGEKEAPKKAEAPAAPAAPAGVTVTIAHAGPLTGSIAHLGKDDENGVALAVAQANDRKLTIGGQPAWKMLATFRPYPASWVLTVTRLSGKLALVATD